MLTLKQEQVERFFWFINERHRITLKKAAGEPWPWTQDKILRKYKFCSVNRELDKETIWIRKNWREPFANHRHLWFAMCIARQINWSPTLAAIGFPRLWNPDRVAAIMRDLKRQGAKIYTGAYMIPGSGTPDKVQYTVYEVLDPLFKDPPPIREARTLEEAWVMLKSRYGFGPFIAYEVITDMRHTRYLNNAPDIMTWANPGPGAMRGNYRILGMSIKPKERERNLSRAEHIEMMRQLLEISPKYLESHMMPLEMRDVEHCECEWDKHERIRLSEGKMRSKYRPPQLELV